ncbi:MAG: zinc ABC transporter substrate-binding protein [Deltaproteobacteria bacterium]|nr:zinc ABC transporter substrate-binding protein [Deltaproteobacteria bacterium]
MKTVRFFYIIVIMCLILSAASAVAGPRPLKVLCSTYPMYVFTSSVAKGSAGVSVDLMLPSALGCPHDYVLTPKDMRKLAEADVLVINGLGMEEFLDASLKKAKPKLKIIDTSAGQKGILRLMGDDGQGHHHGGFNPHLFSSPKRAAQMVKALGESLAALDGKNSSLYRKNAAFWHGRLSGLAASYARAAAAFPNRRIVTQHAVFDYLAEDCGLAIVAVVEDEPGQEPSASDMLEIVKAIRAKKAAALFTEPQYPAKVGETIAREAGIPVAALDPVANGPDGADISHYEAAMQKNLGILKSVLGKK